MIEAVDYDVVPAGACFLAHDVRDMDWALFRKVRHEADELQVSWYGEALVEPDMAEGSWSAVKDRVRFYPVSETTANSCWMAATALTTREDWWVFARRQVERETVG